MNLALMAKLGWKLILESDGLWTRILASKYVRGNINLDKLTKKNGSSNAWRAYLRRLIFSKEGKE